MEVLVARVLKSSCLHERNAQLGYELGALYVIKDSEATLERIPRVFIGVFGKRIYHAKNVPSMLSATRKRPAFIFYVFVVRQSTRLLWQVLCRTCNLGACGQKLHYHYSDSCRDGKIPHLC